MTTLTDENTVYPASPYQQPSLLTPLLRISYIMSQYACSKSKVILVTVRGDPQGCEMLRLRHIVDNRLTDGGEVVSLTLRQSFTARKISGTHLLEAESTPGP
jgi:hypothetical protein